MDDFDEEIYGDSTNSEIRYLTLELMKIAVHKNKSFEEVAKEFINNVYYMKDLISEIEERVKKSNDAYERKHKKSNQHY